jgi:cytoskeleton protein RodZ
MSGEDSMSGSSIGGDELKSGGSVARTALTPGARLRERRELQQLSLESVAMQLHTSAQVVQALEENDASKLPPPVYVRGFLRSYARLLNMPESEVLDARPMPPAAPRPADSEPLDLASLDLAARPRSVLSAALTVGLLAALGLIGWQLLGTQGSTDRPEDVPEPVPAVARPESAAPAALPLPQETLMAPAPATAAPLPLPVETAAPPSASGASAPAVPAKPPEPVPPVPAPAAAVQPPEPAAPPASSTNALVLKFTGESWVTVVDASGQRLLYEAGLPGTSKTVSGKPPLKVTLGRPGNVSLEFNGQPYDHHATDKSGPVRLKIGG